MLDRYTRPEMADLWSLENKYRYWLDVETVAAEGMAQAGMIPASAAHAIRTRGGFDAARIAEIEAEVGHDFIAFLTAVGEQVGEDARFLHQGLTSSDVIDTAFSLLLRQSAHLMDAALERLLTALAEKIETHRHTLCIGRSHGIHAEPTSFGLKLASHYAAFARGRERLKNARAEISVCALSGAVGTFATIDPSVEAFVAEKFGLAVEPVSTQIIPRDRHAAFFATLAVIASSVENFAVELRHLQRTEVREVEEGFGAKQKGSSAMPHKRNPISGENLTGLARQVRAAVIPALENVALWHERDISHSSSERFIAPDATATLHYALHRLAGVVENMVVHVGRMHRNLDATGGLVYSQKILLAMTQKGVAREDAYRIVQKAAMTTWDALQNGESAHFFDALLQDVAIQNLFTRADLDAIANPRDYIRHADIVIGRVLGKKKS